MERFYCLLAGFGIATGLHSQVKPNVVIIMSDQQRADLCGREGFPLNLTPYVDSLALENVWFDKAYTTMAASSPARCSMFTGRFPSVTDVRTNHNLSDIKYQTDMIKVLKDKGYKTALVGKNHSYLKPKDFDFCSAYGHWGKIIPKTDAEKRTAKFLNDEARGQWLEPSPIPLEEQQPVKIVSETLRWIDKQAKDNNPFFVWVSLAEPHNPYQVCEPYYSMFNPDNIPPTRTGRKELKLKDDKYSIMAKLDDESCPDLLKDLPRLRANYMGMIRLIDDQIRRLIETLKKNGQYENTIFLILSDHGDYAGEYGLIRKGAGMSDCLTRIPMVWAGYGIEKSKEPMEAHVSLADVFPTICTAVGSEIPLGVQGRSLWPMLTGKNYPKREFSSIVVQRGYGGANVDLSDDLTFEQEGALTRGKIADFDELNSWSQSGMSRMIRKGDWKLIIDSYGVSELYNIKKDPSEIKNLYDNKKYKDIKIELMNDMLAWELRLQDPLPVPQRRYIFKRNDYNYHFTK